MCVSAGSKILCCLLLLCQVNFSTCIPFRSTNQDLEISSQLSNCKNVIYFPNVEYPVLTSNKVIFGNGCANTQNCGPFRQKNCVTCSDEEDESYKDPKWWKMFADRLKNNKTAIHNNATSTTDSDNISAISKEAQTTINSASLITETSASQPTIQAQNCTPFGISSTQLSYQGTKLDSKAIEEIYISSQTPEVIEETVALTATLENIQNSPLISSQIQKSSVISTELKSNLTSLPTTIANISEILPSSGTFLTSSSSPLSYILHNKPTSMPDLVSTEVLELISDASSSNLDQAFLSTFADVSSLAENDKLITLEDVNTVSSQKCLSPLDSVASAITNLILNPTSVQKRTPTIDTSISEKASFVWMAIPYVDENSTASVIPLVVLKFPPVALNNSLADNSTIEKIVVDSLKKQDVQDIVNANKIKEALLNKTISVVDYYKPLSDNCDSILELTNCTQANTTTDNTFAFIVDKSNSTSLLIDKIKNEVMKSKEVKPDSIEFYVNDLVQNTSDCTANYTKTSKSLKVDQEKNCSNRTTMEEKIPKDDIESGGYFKTIVIKIIRKSDNLTDSKQLDIGDVSYKTDNLVIQIIDEANVD